MTITKDMAISEVVRQFPQTAHVFMEFGMGCLGCSAARFENIEQGAVVHGINVDDLITALNNAVQ